MIRELKPDETHLLLEGGVAFYREAGIPGTFRGEVFMENMGRMIGNGGVVLASFSKEGFIEASLAAAVARCLFSGDRMAVEVFFYVIPRFRGGLQALRLLKAYDAWCRSAAINTGALIHLDKDLSASGGAAKGSLASVYRRLGFQPIETYYIKRYNV